MKLIHCADLHLDSRMESGLPAGKAQERRMEILHTFVKMVDRAAKEGVEAILICGDLFDTEQVTAHTREVVRDTIQAHPEMMFYYLRGNHDGSAGSRELLSMFGDGIHGNDPQMPKNLRQFDNSWTTYVQGQVTITGMELSDGWSPALAEQLETELAVYPDKLHLVLLHGMVSEYGQGEEGIALRDLRGRGIAYLALGHIHTFRQEVLDEQGVWCYSGCLEGRGFDECGEKGYVLLETQSEKVHATFVKMAERQLQEVRVDVSGCRGESEIMDRIRKELAGISSKDLVKIVLTGQISPEQEMDLLWMKRQLEAGFYFLKMKDQTKTAFCEDEYRYDRSLKGEFVRLVQETELSEEDRGQILRLGLQALRGEG